MRSTVVIFSFLALGACGPSAAEKAAETARIEAEEARIKFDEKVQAGLDRVRSTISAPGEVRFSELGLIGENICGHANGREFAVVGSQVFVEIPYGRTTPIIPSTGYAGALQIELMREQFAQQNASFDASQAIIDNCSILAGHRQPIRADSERPGHYLPPPPLTESEQLARDDAEQASREATVRP
tara:strand:- start:4554 stop:5108 length:555 start_codon:yes stop_codon:yes gene_type:complete